MCATDIGLVLVRCACCDKQHLIADNLGWISERGDNIERILAEQGGQVQRLRCDDPELIQLE